MRAAAIGSALVLMLTVCSTILVASPEDGSGKVPIFVKSGAAASGFTDPSKDRQDSVKDLCNKIKDSKLVRVADSELDAVAVLEVLGRENKQETKGWASAFGAPPRSKSLLLVRSTAGEYSTDFSGESTSIGELTSYSAAAGKVVKQLEEWVKANREHLGTPTK